MKGVHLRGVEVEPTVYCLPEALDPKLASSRGQRCSGEASAPSYGLGLRVGVCLLSEPRAVYDVSPSHPFDPPVSDGACHKPVLRPRCSSTMLQRRISMLGAEEPSRGMHILTRCVLERSRLHSGHFPQQGRRLCARQERYNRSRTRRLDSG